MAGGAGARVWGLWCSWHPHSADPSSRGGQRGRSVLAPQTPSAGRAFACRSGWPHTRQVTNPVSFAVTSLRVPGSLNPHPLSWPWSSSPSRGLRTESQGTPGRKPESCSHVYPAVRGPPGPLITGRSEAWGKVTVKVHKSPLSPEEGRTGRPSRRTLVGGTALPHSSAPGGPGPLQPGPGPKLRHKPGPLPLRPGFTSKAGRNRERRARGVPSVRPPALETEVSGWGGGTHTSDSPQGSGGERGHFWN